MSLAVLFLNQALALEEDGDLDTAIACVTNAMCTRNIRPFNRLQMIKILGDMQKHQRNIWRGIK